MTTKTKVLLGISLTSFLISLTGALWGLFLPVGAIVFGLFMIFNMLGKETAAFDEEQRLRRFLAEKNVPGVRDLPNTHKKSLLSAVPLRS